MRFLTRTECFDVIKLQFIPVKKVIIVLVLIQRVTDRISCTDPVWPDIRPIMLDLVSGKKPREFFYSRLFRVQNIVGTFSHVQFVPGERRAAYFAGYIVNG